jgi:hypothetical protein
LVGGAHGDTLTLAEGYVQVKPLGPLKVKGLELPLEVFEIVGATARWIGYGRP